METVPDASTSQLDTVERVAQFLETTRVAWASLVASSFFGVVSLILYLCMGIFPNNTLFEAMGNASLSILLMLVAIFSYRQERAQLRMALLIAGQRHQVSRAFVLDTVVKWRENAKQLPISVDGAAVDYDYNSVHKTFSNATQRRRSSNNRESKRIDLEAQTIIEEDPDDTAAYSWASVYNRVMALLGFTDTLERQDSNTFAGREITPSARRSTSNLDADNFINPSGTSFRKS
mmetsp:Transcript_21762/g.42810  ORF Transcript_21762/g.42810 Transcript_21762/m.42810 type:complete len:233 (+) Transcript_21762:291-989(+)